MPDAAILEATQPRSVPAGRLRPPLPAWRGARGTIALPQLPYAADALAPAISTATIAYHHGRHHKDQVDRLNDAIAGTRYELLPLERIVVEARRDGAAAVLAYAAHAYNHALYWQSLTPNGSAPLGAFATAVERDFGGVARMCRRLAAAALSDPGNGFVWLLLQRGRLTVARTQEQETPLGADGTPLFALDVFAHAYFIDYQDRRDRYVEAALNELAHWSGVSDRYAQAI